MKANLSATTACAFFVFTTIILTACQKETIQPAKIEPGATVTSQRPQAIAKTNDLVLKTFTRNGRTYQFNYSPSGKVDSIVVTGDDQYVYHAFYKGSHLDSVTLVYRGRIVSLNRNFQYKGDLIVGYDYFDRVDEIPFPWSVSVSYDAQKRISSMDRIFHGIPQSHFEWTYNSSGDMVAMLGFGSDDGSFTYDNRLNPLHFVPDLFVLFVEEGYIWEYSFSLHNSMSKTTPGSPTKTYVNQYNDAGQLVKKTFSEFRTVTFSFTYQ